MSVVRVRGKGQRDGPWRLGSRSTVLGIFPRAKNQFHLIMPALFPLSLGTPCSCGDQMGTSALYYAIGMGSTRRKSEPAWEAHTSVPAAMGMCCAIQN